MEPQKIEITGIIKEKPYRKRRTPDSDYELCSFNVECSFIEKIYCSYFLPSIRQGWKVKIIGVRSEKSKTIYAESVEVIKDEPPKQNGEQLKLEGFEK
ncbi:MAG: hypothetical protein WC402_03110 [Candidatus Pacearchaeota archaeon]|jgi:hypothetical protein